MPEVEGFQLELASLPGVGKTTVARELAKRLSSRISFFGIHTYWLRKLRFIWLFTPYARIKFRRVFARLGDTDPGVQRSLLYLLNVFLAERCLASIEARLTRRVLILDEGFIQRGLGLWMRAPLAIRDDVWLDFLDCVPPTLACVVLTLDPVEALRRARQRSHGLPPGLRDDEPGGPSGETLSERYAGLERLLQGDALHERIRCIRVPAEGDPAALAERIATEMARALPHERLDASMLFIRETHGGD